MSTIERPAHLIAAAEAAQAAWNVMDAARTAAYRADGERLRLELLHLVDSVRLEHGVVITGFDFETQYEYNDEGGYYNTVNPSVTIDEETNPEGIDFHDDLYDLDLYPPTLAYMAKGDEDEDFSFTVEQLRSMSFAPES